VRPFFLVLLVNNACTAILSPPTIKTHLGLRVKCPTFLSDFARCLLSHLHVMLLHSLVYKISRWHQVHWFSTHRTYEPVFHVSLFSYNRFIFYFPSCVVFELPVLSLQSLGRVVVYNPKTVCIALQPTDF
jgi:hypothetical protein